MFKVLYGKASNFKTILDVLSHMIDEGSFKFDQNGMSLVAIDKAHISLATIEILTNAFKDYEVDEEFNFGFNTLYLLKIFKGISSKDELEISSSSPDVVKIVIYGDNSREYNVRNLSVEQPSLPKVNMDFPAKAVIPSKGFKSAIDQVSTVSDTVVISANDDSLVIRTPEDNKDAKVEVVFDKSDEVQINVNSKVESAYSADYLSYILGLTKISGTTSIGFDEKKPIQINFESQEGGKVTYLLAPKVS
ncbi:proliferating cell nuclear antigen (pcna) [Sulfuracidifex tepidarius]|uniref:DNA polymerase sliding clamp n=1 Tax=Sulfuracidifex tepidarius TaxID=1294262 RepID=A0A510E364_9CREN|nr:proliferating cell nuclear antigen (pcna) [Sulfuracidifex tepidarius]BBG24194.1 DNA polymerase sliding clamp 3 [Sulfuracidifex tepidarius]BBG26951.1 DNA polymerase sliding clamp 3 [Sulfuracidifex tepidarius]